jgi:hypothetical protein
VDSKALGALKHPPLPPGPPPTNQPKFQPVALKPASATAVRVSLSPLQSYHQHPPCVRGGCVWRGATVCNQTHSLLTPFFSLYASRLHTGFARPRGTEAGCLRTQKASSGGGGGERSSGSRRGRRGGAGGGGGGGGLAYSGPPGAWGAGGYGAAPGFVMGGPPGLLPYGPGMGMGGYYEHGGGWEEPRGERGRCAPHLLAVPHDVSMSVRSARVRGWFHLAHCKRAPLYQHQE